MVHEEKTIITTTTNDHNHHHKKPSPYTSNNIHRAIATTIVIILILIAITSLILWLLYNPHKPKFTVVAATAYGNTSPPVTTAMQVTIITRNPNTRVSIHYDRLVTFLSYQNRPVTPPLMLPPLHHARDSTVAVTPTWPVTVDELVGDDVGMVSLKVVLNGSLRYKYGSMWKSRRKNVYVECDVLVGLKKGVLGQVPLVKSSLCRVDI
ncbi:hypothetical protein QVD17_18153 [Tagetes erecta]|uniref:Late embryogenesis abundant protein LEA-2 subgroup domain-containing protein n=1 Tax=Tagetes erecta TaxID=13708 RepID=A0AAD8KH18_TARER|nr:hypothetical protein QVD17_18153 [Tagetes erecta]